MSGPPNMAATVERFSVPVTRRRYTTAPTVNAEGFRDPGGFIDTEIRMHVYPAPGKVIAMLEPGHQGKRVEMGGTTDDVRTSTKGGPRSDEILHDDATFEIIAVARWGGGPAGATAFREATMVEVTR